MNTMAIPLIVNKPMEFYCTLNASTLPEFDEYVRLALKALMKEPVDLLVFEFVDGRGQIRLSGHDLRTGRLDEETVVLTFKSAFFSTFWLKVDDYGERFVGTFLYPAEY